MIPQTPPAPPTKTRYPMSMITLARRMYGDGDAWQITQIRNYLRDEFDASTLTIGTVRRWVIPSYDDEQRRWNTESYRRRAPRPDGPDVARLRALRVAGLSYPSLAIVANLDYGTILTGEELRHAFNAGQVNELLERST